MQVINEELHVIFHEHASERIIERVQELKDRYDDVVLTVATVRADIRKDSQSRFEFIENAKKFKIYNKNYILEYVTFDVGTEESFTRHIVTVTFDRKYKKKKKPKVVFRNPDKEIPDNVHTKLYKKKKRTMYESDEE